jgi:hypothetical protein
VLAGTFSRPNSILAAKPAVTAIAGTVIGKQHRQTVFHNTTVHGDAFKAAGGV